LQVIAEEEVVGVEAILAVEAVVELAAVGTFVAELALTCDEVIHAIFGVVRGAVEAILGIDGAEGEVAALAVAEIIAVVAVFGIDEVEADARDIPLQGGKLFEERLMEVERAAC